MEWIRDPLFWTTVAGALGVVMLLPRVFGSGRKRPEQGEDESKNSDPLREACRLAKDALIVIDYENRILFANPAAEKLGELRPGTPLKEIPHSLDFYHEEERHWFTLEGLLQKHRLRKGSGTTLFADLTFDREKRTQVTVEIRTSRHYSKRGGHSYDIVSIHDASCEKKLFDLHHLNTLSGLPNQFKAYSDITAITAQGSDRNRFAVIMVELDDASRLRSMLGYAEMEKIITHIANVLREMRENPRISIYHINYVNFMILLKQPNSIDEIYGTFEQFQLQVQESYNILQNKQKLTFSAGISLYPNNTSLYSLIDNAYGALAQAQEEGRGHIVLASREMNQRLDHEILLNTEIEKGLANRDFKLYFQPIYDSKDERLAGAEVLLRWHHPEKGLLMPDLFIPIAEKSGLILQIGKYVIEESLKQLSRWHSFGFPPLQLSLNLSLRELEHQEFTSFLTQMLYQYETGESRLKFEITEHTTMLNPTLAHKKLNEIRQLGIGISLDDFGTGYSSFSHLAEFPIETLKIDRSFVTGLARDSSKRHIVTTITKLGHSLGMTIIAEGVETREEAILLGSYGVDYLQGYYFSRPLPQLEFQYLLSHS